MKNKDLKEKIRAMLAELLGIEASDIQDEDSFTNDLHADPVILSDFVKTLEEEGFEISVDITEIDTFEDLVDSINSVYSE